MKEKIFLGGLALLACLSIVFYLHYNEKASPQYAVSFDITREESEAKARQFLESQDLKVDKYKRATVFTYNQEDADTYLQREVGVERTGELARNDVDLWHFNSRFFRPSQQEEYSVSFLPNGRLSGFERVIPENAEGASISRDEARGVAEKFIEDSARYRLDDWHVVDERSENRPNRTDHTFVFEKSGFREKDATYRMEVDVLGDKVGKYTEFLKVPESWERDWAKERSKNELAGSVAGIAMFVFFVLPIFVLAVKLYKRRALRPRFAILAGGLSASVTFLMLLNAYPSIVYAYDTTQSWSVFMTSSLLFGLLDALTIGLNGISGGLMVFVILIVGEAMYREAFPEKMALEHVVSKGFRSKSFAKALFIGSCVGIVDIAFQVAYYIIGQKVGIWSPADIAYDDIMSSIAPWIFPLFIGLTAALSEEGIFRLFGISFLKKYIKHTWLVVLIVSIIFGFVHSNYPQMPWFSRGIEITIPAILWAIVFLRYGFAASFAIHYTTNAFGTALGMLSFHGNAQALFLSILVGLFPLLLSVILWMHARRKGGFETDESQWSNASVTKTMIEKEKLADTVSEGNRSSSEAENTSTMKSSYNPLSLRIKWLLAIAAVLGAWSALLFRSETTLQETEYPLTRQEIGERAVDALARKGVDTSVYQETASMESRPLDTSAVSYILQRSDFATLKQATEKTSFEGWSVRFFKPLDKEEYRMLLLPDGTVYDTFHVMDEKAEGKRLSSEDASALATRYLENERHLDMSRYTTITQEAEQKDARTDYHFVFEEQGIAIGEATYRIGLDIIGDEPGNLHPFVKVPEEWERDRDAVSMKDVISWSILVIAVIMIITFSIREFLHQNRDGGIDYRSAKKVAWIFVGIGIIGRFNDLPLLYKDYETTTAIWMFFAQNLLGDVFGAVLLWILIVCVVGFGAALWKKFVRNSFPENIHERRCFYADALFAGYTLPFVVYGIPFAIDACLIRHNWIDASIVSSGFFDKVVPLESFFPAWNVVQATEMRTIFLMMFISLCLVMYKQSRQRIAFVLLSFIGMAALTAIAQSTALESWLMFANNSLTIISVFLAARFILRDNVLSYATYLIVSTCLFMGMSLFRQPNTFFSLNGAIAILLSLLPLIVFFVIAYNPFKSREK